MNDQTSPPHDQPAPPIPAPCFLQDVKVWRSPTGIWFLRSEALQTGGVLRVTPDYQGSRWILFTPCDFDQWACIMQGIACDLQSAVDAVAQAMPTVNAKPT